LNTRNGSAAVSFFRIGIGALSERALKYWRRWQYFAIPENGITITVQCATLEPIEMKVADFSYSLPKFQDLEPRPEHMMPKPDTYSDMTIVSKTFRF
jgi:hypothetical protein